MSRKNGSARSQAPPRSTADAEHRFSFLTSEDLARRVRHAAYRSNLTLSDVINWCLDHGLDAFSRAHPSPDDPRPRPGKPIRLLPRR